MGNLRKRKEKWLSAVGKRKCSVFFSLSFAERMKLLIKSICVLAVFNYCFYRSFSAFLVLAPVGIYFYRKERTELLFKKKAEARQQFKELLILAAAEQKAGYSVEHAFLNSYEDLAGLFGRESSICRMLSQLSAGLSNNIPVEDLWISLGEETDIGEIKEFARVFLIARQSGGSMTAVMGRTAETIEMIAETQKEIETLLSAGRLEQRIMNVTPFFLMMYVSFTSPGYFDGLFHTLEGACLMSVSLLFYLAAYLFGEKISAVKAG